MTNITTTDRKIFTLSSQIIEKNDFGNKRIVPITEVIVLDGLNKRITLLKKQLAEWIDKKELIKEYLRNAPEVIKEEPKKSK